jgi:hypothetical protein
LLSVLPTVPAPIPVSFAISDAVFGPDRSDRRIFALFAPRGARAPFAAVALVGLRAGALLLALAGARRLRLAVAALDRGARGVAVRDGLAVLLAGFLVLDALEARRGRARLLDARRVVVPLLDLRLALAARTELGKRFSISSASERSSPIVPRAALVAFLLASPLSSLSVLATCLRSPASRKRSNKSLSFWAIAFSSKLGCLIWRAATLSSGEDRCATLRPLHISLITKFRVRGESGCSG